MEDLSLNIVLLTVKIILMWYCISKAGDLNRNKWGWAVFSFFAPVIAAISIQFVSPKDKVTNARHRDLDWNNDEILDA